MSADAPVGSVLSALRAVILACNSPGDLSGAFARHVLADIVPWRWDVDPAPGSRSGPIAGPVQYPQVAALGYSISAGRTELRSEFAAGVSRLRPRDPFPPDGQSFGRDPIALLGLALGARSVGGEATGWIEGLLTDPRAADTTSFGDLLNEVSLATLRGTPSASVRRQPSPDALAVQVWAEHRGLLQPARGAARSADSARDDLSRLLLVEPEMLDGPRAATAYAAVVIALRGTLAVLDGADAVAALLARFEAGMRRWPADGRWPIRDEKDVQSIVFLLLRSVWDDVVDEENIGKLGHSSYIPDFRIPSLRLLVEVKFARARADLKKIEGELLVDAAAYGAASAGRSDSMVVFVYDDSSSVQDHDLLISAIESVDFVSRVVVASRPLAGKP